MELWPPQGPNFILSISGRMKGEGGKGRYSLTSRARKKKKRKKPSPFIINQSINLSNFSIGPLP